MEQPVFFGLMVIHRHFYFSGNFFGWYWWG